ncbi:MAG: TlpA family protein disulfide reductase [Chitinophagales bacterium]
MRSNFQLLLLFCFITVTTNGQDDQSFSLNIGDPAPLLRVREWIKGQPVQRFEKGNMYVVEFWATWCIPCIAAMPHLSDLAGEYKNRVTILGIDIYEKKTTSMEKVKAFVDSMGQRMDYRVAAADSNFMVTDWFDASGEKGIPKTFIVNAEGRVAWIGHPKYLAVVLPKILNNNWDIKEALAKRNLYMHLNALDDSLSTELLRFNDDPDKPYDLGKPDSALLVINEMIRKEPRLEYAPGISAITFSSLLKTNLDKAYEYGKTLLVTSTYNDAIYDDPNYHIIFGNIKAYSDKLNLPAEIYRLGAEAYQTRIDAFPETAVPIFYNNMAEFYWRACDKSKAIAIQQKAIEALKIEKHFSATNLAAFEFRLQQYKRM